MLGLRFGNVENFTAKKADDFVIATGKQYSVKDFTNIAAKRLGIKLKWIGKGLQEKAINLETNSVIVEVNKSTLDQQK